MSRIIPADELGPGALEAGAAEFIDRQMNTPYATGAQWYMQGPFKADAAPELGYQLQLSPQQIYRLGIAAVEAWCKNASGKTFAEQDSATRDKILGKIEAGEIVFEQLPAKVFFSLLVQNTRKASSATRFTAATRAWSAGRRSASPAPGQISWTGSSATSRTRSRRFRFVARGRKAWPMQ